VSWTDRLDDRASDVLAVAAAALAADGVAPLSGHVLDALGTGVNRYLLVPDSGRLAGLAVSSEHDPAELVVDPALRRRGWGRTLLTAALERSGAVWAHGDLAPAQALAREFGLVRSRELLQMRRPLDTGWAATQVEASPLPPGVRLRTFVPGQDEQAFLGVNARAFDWHPEQGRLDLAGLQLEMAQPWFDPAGFFLAVDTDDTVLGFHWTKVHTPELTPADVPAGGGAAAAGAGSSDVGGAGAPAAAPGSIGEVYVLGVDPAALLAGERVRGLGAPLTAAGLAYLAARGLTTVMLYVEGDNEPALRLYRRLGFTVSATDVVYRRPV
jgi:mycothiol synthase